MVAFHQDGEHQSGVIGPRGLPKSVVGPFELLGGLLAYAPDRVDQYRRAAGYVDRILKGEKPADLPLREPTRYALSSIARRQGAWPGTPPESAGSRRRGDGVGRGDV